MKSLRRTRRAASPKGDDLEGLSFSALLAARAKDPAKRKGERTRDRLKAAAAKHLEKSGYRELRVSDIHEAAGVSNALFYLYFKNKDEIAEEILVEFLGLLFASDGPKPASTEEAIYAANLHYARWFAANPGLMRCLLQFGDEIVEFGQLWRKFNNQWAERVVASLKRDPEVALSSEDEFRGATFALGAMVDATLRLAFVDRDPSVRASLTKSNHGAAEIARFLTRLWVRSLFAREPKLPL